MITRSTSRNFAYILAAVFFFGTVFGADRAWAWGRRGHQIVGETAAQILGASETGLILRHRSFDIAYYSNVPDVVWKKPATYETERHNHYMDIESYLTSFGSVEKAKKQIELERASFDKENAEFKQNNGRAFWRIRELEAKLKTVSDTLTNSTEMERTARHELQGQWLVLAGLISHYVGDLGQPLHTTTNHDGQSTNQKGVHFFFEDSCVDELYPQLAAEVLGDARRQWAEFHKKNDKKDLLDLLNTLTMNSHKQLEPLLKIDRQVKRQNLKKAAQAFHKLIRSQMVASSLVLTEIYSRRLGWKYDSEKFYDFTPSPEFIQPGADIIKQ